jgi:magnesium-transporting ATPase (P-type)
MESETCKNIFQFPSAFHCEHECCWLELLLFKLMLLSLLCLIVFVALVLVWWWQDSNSRERIGTHLFVFEDPNNRKFFFYRNIGKCFCRFPIPCLTDPVVITASLQKRQWRLVFLLCETALAIVIVTRWNCFEVHSLIIDIVIISLVVARLQQ